MKLVYILIVFVVAALTLGCIGNKLEEPTEPSTSAPIAPVDTSVSPSATTAPANEDPFETDMDVAALESMLADSSMDISLMDSI